MKKSGEFNHKNHSVLVTRPLEDSICFTQKVRKIILEKGIQRKFSYDKGESKDSLKGADNSLERCFRFEGSFYIQPLLAVDAITPPSFIYRGESLIFTSRHGVRFFVKNFKNYVGDNPSHKNVRKVWCVGEKTAALAKDAGFSNVVEGEGNALALLQKIQGSQEYINLDTSLNAGECAHGFIHISGEDTTIDFEKVLTPWCKRIVLYRTVAAINLRKTVIKALDRGDIDTILLYSKKTARTFLKLYPQLDENIHIVGLSEAITSLFPMNPSSIYPNEDAIVMALSEKTL